MKIFAFFLFLYLFININSIAQNDDDDTIRIIGNANDPKIIAIKEKLESQGKLVAIQAKKNNPILTNKKSPIKIRYINKPLIPFELKNLEGKKINSNAMKGKMMFLYFFDIEDKNAVQEFSKLNELKKKYKNENIVFIAFCEEKVEKTKEVITKNNLELMIIPQAKKYFNELGIHKSRNPMVVFFVDKNNVVKYISDDLNLELKDINGKRTMEVNNVPFYEDILEKMIKEHQK
ncbi:MAG: hypothetical protein EAZ06_09680 [Cytophagales bacterium]|nr:MAG: hypothetical protein EAZ06_09680 [Cytophagales bacterium]